MTAAQAVAVVCLIPVADESQAVKELRRVPALAEEPAGALHKIARWLRQLYPNGRPDSPTTPAGWWGGLEPDLLAERHVTDQLAEAPDLARRCWRNLSPDQAQAALTVLARACAHQQRAADLITAALRDDLADLAIPAVQVAVQTGGKLGEILAAILVDANAQQDALIKIEGAIPHPTVTLAAAHATVVGRIIEMLPENAEQRETARWLDRYSILLSQAGRPAEALSAAQGAIAIYRDLAAASPDLHLPDLAASLDHLGLRLFGVGRRTDALAAAQEAVTIYRDLAAENYNRYRPDLARALDHLGVRLLQMGRPADALPATMEAVTIYRDLAAENPDRYRPDLARSLNNLCVWLAELGRSADALPMIEEAVTIYRDLVAASPDRYRPDLARSLTVLGSRRSAAPLTRCP